jgi:pimeloyl-ACP methyl ester carboxylesterase
MKEHELATADGRRLAVLECGDPAGRPVLVHNGMPNSRLLFHRDAELAERQGIRLMSYDRPGYGGSSRHPGRTVADCAQDVRDIAAGLRIDQLAVWGVSGGGPHALACAALLPDLVPAVAAVATTAPWDAPGLDYFAGMGDLNVEDTLLLMADPVAARAKCETDRLEMMAVDLPGVMEFMESLLAPADAAELSGELGQHMVDALHSGLAPGSDGWWDDELAMLAPWGFELSAIRTPVLVCHGRQDRFVPFAHGEWVAGQIPGVRTMLSDDDGHLTITAHHLGEIHDWLLERLTV